MAERICAAGPDVLPAWSPISWAIAAIAAIAMPASIDGSLLGCASGGPVTIVSPFTRAPTARPEPIPMPCMAPSEKLTADPGSAAAFSVFFSSRRRHTRLVSDWSSDVCSSDLGRHLQVEATGDIFQIIGVVGD